MYNLLIALSTGGIVFIAFLLWLGPVEAVLPGVVAAVAVYFLLARRVNKRLESLVLAAQKELQNRRFDNAIRVLESGFRFCRWQFFTAAQVHANLGVFHFLEIPQLHRRDISKAMPHLEKSLLKHWIARGMLGVCHFKRKDRKKMVESFEVAVKANKKVAILWNLYAYCLERYNRHDDAIQVLIRATKKLPDDKRTQANLLALQNRRKMKMRAFQEEWYRFGLEMMPAVRQQIRPQFRTR